MPENESFEIVEPDIEVIVRVGEYEIGVFGIFQNKSGVWDLVIGVDDTERIESLTTVLHFIASALPSASFRAIRTSGEFYDWGGEEKDTAAEVSRSAQSDASTD